MFHRIQPGARLSQAVVCNGFVFISGQATEDPTLDVAAQTRHVLARIDALLAEAGSDKTKIAFANISLADIADYPEMNREWDAWVVPGEAPARACGEARVSLKPYRVEINVVAQV